MVCLNSIPNSGCDGVYGLQLFSASRELQSESQSKIVFWHFFPFSQVLLYNGQLDIIVGVPLTENFLQQLKWSGQDDYNKASRAIWRLGDDQSDVAGYIKQVGRFRQVSILCCSQQPFRSTH